MDVRPNETVDRSCPLCGAVENEVLGRFPDGVVVGRCRCGLTYTPVQHARPSGLFEDADPERLRETYRPIAAGRVRHIRDRSFGEYLRAIRGVVPVGRLLDVGCAHGLFLRKAREAGFEVAGIEPYLPFATIAREEMGLPVRVGRLEEVSIEGEDWDLITFCDSFEYLPDPLRALARARGGLRASGVLFLKVPNADYFALRARLGGRRAFAISSGPYSPSRRVVHYTEATLARLLEKAGFRVVASGSFRPIHPETEAVGARTLVGRAVREVLHLFGRAERALLGKNHLSQSIYAIARPERSTGRSPSLASPEGRA